MADQAFPDGDLAHPDRPNAYGPVQYPIRSLAVGLVRPPPSAAPNGGAPSFGEDWDDTPDREASERFQRKRAP